MTFTLHTENNAPDGARKELENSIKSFGWVPNLHAVLAEAPEVLSAYKKLHELFQQTSFNAEELTVVWQTINVENQCNYCIPAHTGIAHMMSIDANIISALAEDKPLPNEKLQALKDATLSLMRNRGHLEAAVLNRFNAVGYGNQQLLEILLGLAQKTISNYTNHLANTPVDEAFVQFV